MTQRNQLISTHHLYSFQDTTNKYNTSPVPLFDNNGQNQNGDETQNPTRFQMPQLLMSQVLKEKPNGTIITPHKISLVDKYITKIDTIPKKFTKIDTLFLSNNCIESLEGIEQFQMLNVLSIANNCISSFYELNYLNQLPQLKVLNLEFNPVTQLPYYRYQVVHRVPSVRLLDQKEVTTTERTKATRILKKEETTLNLMFSNEALIAKISRALEKMKFKQEYRDELIQKIEQYDKSELRRLDANGIIELYGLTEIYTEDDRPIVYELLRKEVRKIHNIRLFGGGSMREALQNTLPVVGKPSKKLQAANAKKRQTFESWDICYSEVLLHQQSKIAALLYDLEHEHNELLTEIDNSNSSISNVDSYNQKKPHAKKPWQSDEGLQVVRQIQDEMNQLIEKSNETSTSRMLDNFTKNYVFEEPNPNQKAPFSKDALMTPNPKENEHATTLAYTLPPKQQEPRFSPQPPSHRPLSSFNGANSAPVQQERPSSPLPRTVRPIPEENYTSAFNSSVHVSSSQDNDARRFSEFEDVTNLKHEVRELKAELERRKRGEETLQELNLKLRERLEEFKQKNSENIDRAHREVMDYKQKAEDAQRQIQITEAALHESKSKISELEQTIDVLKEGPSRGKLIDQLRETRQQKDKLEVQLKNAQETMIENVFLGNQANSPDSGKLLSVIAGIVSEDSSIDIESIKFFAYSPQAEEFRRKMVLKRQKERLRLILQKWRTYVKYQNLSRKFEVIHQNSTVHIYFLEWRKKWKNRMTAKTRLEHARLYYEHKLLKRTFTRWKIFKSQSLEMNKYLEIEAEHMHRRLIMKRAFDSWKQWMEEYVYSFRQKVAAFRDYHYRRLLVNTFYRWKERFHQKIEENRKFKRASDLHNYNTLKSAFINWREITQKKLQRKVQKQQAELFHELLLLRKSLRILHSTVKYNHRMKDVHIRAYDFLFQSLRRKYFGALKSYTRKEKYKRQLSKKGDILFLKKYFHKWFDLSQKIMRKKRVESIGENIHNKRNKKILHTLFTNWNEATKKRHHLLLLQEHSEKRLRFVKIRFFFGVWRSRYTERLQVIISEMNENVLQLQSKSMSFSSNNKEYEIENLNLVNKIHDLTGEISRQNVAISDQSFQVQRLENELREAALIEHNLREEIGSLKEQNNDFRDEIAMLKANLVHYADVPTESLEMVIEKQTSRGQISALKETIGMKDREIDRLQSLISTLEGGEAYQQQKLREAYEVISQLRATLEEKEEEIIAIKVQYGQNNVLVRDWRKKVEVDEQEILNKNETIRTLTQKLLDAREREKMYNLTVHERDNELEKMKFEMDFLTSSPDANDDEREEHGEDYLDNDENSKIEENELQYGEDKELRDTLMSNNSLAKTMRNVPKFRNDETPLREYSSQLPSKLLSPYSSVSSLPAVQAPVPDTTVYSTQESTQIDSDQDYDEEIKKLTSSILSGLKE